MSVPPAHFRTISLDLLGHGMTAQSPANDYRIGALTDHVARFIEVIGARQVHVVGQSLGGWVAAWLALTRPHRIGRLFLIEPQGLQSEEERLAEPGAAALSARRRGLRQSDARGRAQAADRPGRGSRPDRRRHGRDALAAHQPEASRAVHQYVRRADNANSS